MPETEAPSSADLAQLSTAMITARLAARRAPGQLTDPAPAGYQRTLQWVVRDGGEELVVLWRDHIAPWSLDHESVEAALPLQLVVLEQREMPRRGDARFGVCYRVGPPPPPDDADGGR